MKKCLHTFMVSVTLIWTASNENHAEKHKMNMGNKEYKTKAMWKNGIHLC